MNGVTGAARAWLRAEGLCAFALGVMVYGRLEQSWLAFALLFMVPDLSLASYLAGPRVGAALYNVAHSYVGPALLAGCGLLFGSSLLAGLGAIWAAHIGFDRVLGYGLKYPSSFRHTHLGTIGREGSAENR